MRQYKMEMLNGELFVIEFEPAPTHFQNVKHGPYKNRKSAQNRIRTLSNKDVHGNLVTPIEPLYTKEQIAAAIDAEALDWAKFFNSTDLEGRKATMRANVAVGYFKPLLPYLPEPAPLVFRPATLTIEPFVDPTAPRPTIFQRLALACPAPINRQVGCYPHLPKSAYRR